MSAGLICGLLAIVVSLGNVTLLARGPLAGEIGPLVAVVLFGAALMPIVTAYLSAIPGQVTTTQEISVVAMVSILGSVVASLAASAPGLNPLPTVLVTIALTTVLCGATMVLLGVARLGRITRFVPYPVFAGFLAITGWYLLTGGIETVLGHSLELEHLARIAEPDALIKLGLAIAFTVALQLLNPRVPSGVLPPISVALLVVLFNLVVVGASIPRTTLEETGWIFTLPAAGIAWPPIGVDDLAQVHWPAVWSGLLFAPIVVVITAAAAMMNVSGIELDTRSDVDLNRELRSMGIGNVLGGLGGGIPGFPAVSATLLAVRFGAPYRAVGVVAGLVALAAMLFATQLLGAVPAPLLGALLMWFGVDLLIDWVIKPIRSLRRSEYAIILVILAVSIAAGFPAGIATGLLVALVLFAVEYARVDGIRFVASGRDYHSRLLADEHRELLEQHGAAITVMKLSGYLFFGTADRIVQRVTSSVRDGPKDRSFVVLDFSRVTGLDSSIVMSFQRLQRLAERSGFHVVFAGLRNLSPRLAAGGLDLEAPVFRLEPDLDAGVSWAERQVLGLQPGDAPATISPQQTLSRLLGDEALAAAIVPQLELAEFKPGDRLIEQGSQADDIYFIEAGNGAVVIESQQHAPLTLLTFEPGTILGEIAFYLAAPRTASAIADGPVRAWKLSRRTLDRIAAEHPAAATAFHEAVARTLAGRVQSANRLIGILAD